MQSNIEVLCVSRAPSSSTEEQPPHGPCHSQRPGFGSVCQCGLCWYGVEILSMKNKLWRPLVPQGMPNAVSSDLAPLYSTLNRQDWLETLQFLSRHLSQPFSCIVSFSKSPEAKSNPLVWHSGPLYEAYWPATLRWSLLLVCSSSLDVQSFIPRRPWN